MVVGKTQAHESNPFIQRQFMSNSITLFGAAHFDRTGWLDAPAEEGRSNPGRFEECIGGAALNVAGVLSSMGMSPRLISRLGNDELADNLFSTAKQRGVDVCAQRSTQHNTGTYTSLIEPNGSLFIALADMAVYDGFDIAPHLDDIRAAKCDSFICVDANLPKEQIEKIVKNTPARCVGLTVSKAKSNRLSCVLPHLDMLFSNRAEVLELTGASSLELAIKSLQTNGPKNTIISDGADAVWVIEGDEVRNIAVPTLNEVVDVTGAGDALVGGTLFGLSNGYSLVNSVEIGVQAAQKMIQTKGPWCPNLAGALDISSTSNS